MRIPPDPQCNDRGYQATVVIKSKTDQKEVTRFVSDQDGNFTVKLPPGEYILDPQSPNVMPRGIPQDVKEESGKYIEIVIQFDSGIR